MPTVRCPQCSTERTLREGTIYAYCHCCGAKIQVRTDPALKQEAALHPAFSEDQERPEPISEEVTPPAPASPDPPASPRVIPVSRTQPAQYRVPMSSVSAAVRAVPDGKVAMQQQAEQRELFTRATLLGAVFLVMRMVAYLLSRGYSLLYQLFPQWEFFNADSGCISDELFYIFWSPACFFLVALVAFALLRVKPYEVISFSRPAQTGVGIGGILVGLGVAFVGNVVTDIVSIFFGSMGLDLYSVSSPTPVTGVGITLDIISTMLIPAVCEEFLCRGLALGYLRKYGDRLAVIVSAALFALMHGNFDQIPFTFLLGLWLGYITVAADSIWPAVIIHAINNGLSCAFVYLTQGLSDRQSYLCSLLYYALFAVCGIIGLLILLTRRKHLRPVNNEYPGLLTVKERGKRVFLSPTILVFALVMLARAVKAVEWIG